MWHQALRSLNTNRMYEKKNQFAMCTCTVKKERSNNTDDKLRIRCVERKKKEEEEGKNEKLSAHQSEDKNRKCCSTAHTL